MKSQAYYLPLIYLDLTIHTSSH